MELLSGEVHSNDEEAGFKVYTLNASFELGCVYRVIDAYGLSCYLDFSKLALTEEFDELPEDYKCPMCGATADMFEKVE